MGMSKEEFKRKAFGDMTTKRNKKIRADKNKEADLDSLSVDRFIKINTGRKKKDVFKG